MSVSTGDLKQLIRDVLREKQAEAPPVAKGPIQSEGTHVGHCVDCYRETIAIVSGKGKTECKDCHLPLGDKKMMEALKVCPRCGGDRAIEVF